MYTAKTINLPMLCIQLKQSIFLCYVTYKHVYMYADYCIVNSN